MLQVFKGDRAGIVEYFLGLFERDTMLFGILGLYLRPIRNASTTVYTYSIYIQQIIAGRPTISRHERATRTTLHDTTIHPTNTCERTGSVMVVESLADIKS